MGYSKLWYNKSEKERAEIESALLNLPFVAKKAGESSGEGLNAHAGAAWKRVLQYRIAKYTQPRRILQTHGGNNIGSQYYLAASPESDMVVCRHWESEVHGIAGTFDLIDIDPYGCPIDVIDATNGLLAEGGVLIVTSGMAFQAKLGYIKGNPYSGRDMGKWASDDYVPMIAERADLAVIHYYVHPNMIRITLGNSILPASVFNDCPTNMSFIK